MLRTASSKKDFVWIDDEVGVLSGVTSINIGQGGQSPPRFSGGNTTLIGGVVSVQKFRRFARVLPPSSKS